MIDTTNERKVSVMKKRKIVALLSASALAVSALAGCSGGSGGSGENGGGSSSSEDGTYNVVIENVTLGAEYKDTAAIEEAINAITEPAIGCTVTIMNIGIADHANRMSMMIAGGEKMDLCMTGLTTNLVSMVNDGMLYELDEYMDTAGKDLETLLGDDLEAGKVNGTLYGITANNTSGQAAGFLYNKEISDAAGVTVPEKCTLEEFLALYDQVRAANPDLYLTSMGEGATPAVTMIDPVVAFGDSTYFSYGVVTDPLSGSTTIENWYASDKAHEFYSMIKEWQDSGIVPSDSMTSGVIPQDMFKAGSSWGVFTGYSPMELPTQAPSYEFEVGIVQLTDQYKDTDMVQQRMWGVPVTSENPEKAIEFLNFMYTNTDVANLLTNGLEGTNYELTDQEGIVNKIDAANPGYQRVFSMFGDQTKVFYNTPAEAGIQDEIAAFAESAQPTATLGYVFDSTPVAAKAAAVSNIVQQYGPSLEVGLVDDVDEALDQIVEAMNGAGIEDVIAENQKQLDTWLEGRN